MGYTIDISLIRKVAEEKLRNILVIDTTSKDYEIQMRMHHEVIGDDVVVKYNVDGEDRMIPVIRMNMITGSQIAV